MKKTEFKKVEGIYSVDPNQKPKHKWVSGIMLHTYTTDDLLDGEEFGQDADQGIMVAWRGTVISKHDYDIMIKLQAIPMKIIPFGE